MAPSLPDERGTLRIGLSYEWNEIMPRVSVCGDLTEAAIAALATRLERSVRSGLVCLRIDVLEDDSLDAELSIFGEATTAEPDGEDEPLDVMVTLPVWEAAPLKAL